MRFSILIWSFVAAFCLYQAFTIGTMWGMIGFLTGFFLSLYMWIYALVFIIRNDFPVQVKLNIDTKVNGNEINKEESGDK